MAVYDISIRTVKNNIAVIRNMLISKGVNIVKLLVTREVGSVNENEHFHYHLTVESLNKIETVMKDIRKVLKEIYKNKSYYVKKVRDRMKHLIYITKDGDITENIGYTQEQLDELEEKNEEIEKDKLKPLYQKLYDYVIEETTDKSMLVDRRFIIRLIIQKFKQWDKLPPNRTAMYQYLNYIQMKTDLSDIVVEQYI